MTAPITGLSLLIDDDGIITLSAPDASAEGHLWAIERRVVTIEQLRAVAAILGPDVQSGVENRLQMILKRLDERAAMYEAQVKQASYALHRAVILRESYGEGNQ